MALYILRALLLLSVLCVLKPVMSGRKVLRVKEIASIVVGGELSTPVRTKKRVGKQDIKTPMRKNVALRAQELTRGKRMSNSVFEQLCDDFPSQNRKKNFVRKQLKDYRQQLAQGIPSEAMEWSRKRKKCGRGCEKCDVEVAEKLIRVNDKYWGILSFKKLAGKLKEEEGIDVSPRTICTWSKALRMIRLYQTKTDFST